MLWSIPLLLVTFRQAPTPAAPEERLARYVYPLSKPIPAPPFVIDVTDAPEAKPWAEAASRLAAEWFSTICTLLATEDYEPPKEIKLIFKKELNVPAYAFGGSITINADWIRRRPDDFGMVIHELTHVIQSYPNSRYKPGWLVEGIADYIRWWRYEPEAPRTRIDPEKAKYTDAYRTTAHFLAWVSDKYDRRLVPALDRALRKREDPMPVFEQVTGKNADDLWKEFVQILPK